MASIRWLSVMLAAAVVGFGCSFIVQFDPDSQPCDTGFMCSPNYVCVRNADGDGGICKFNDGGVVVEDDAGMSDASTCTARETQCGDGRDNDCDNTTDCADSDCTGVACDDGDRCTTGEVCFGGSCPRGTAVTCNTPGDCRQMVGTCSPTTGACVYPQLPDGTSCGAAPGRCCSGTCVNITLTGAHCGGCGLACGAGQVCQPINSSGCSPQEPANTSGRCTCTTGPDGGCPNGQTCTNGVCYPSLASQCSGGMQGIQATNSSDGGNCGFYCRY